MKSHFFRLPVLSPAIFAPLLLLLSACSAHLPEVTSPSTWFEKEDEVMVNEVANASQCNSSGEEPSVEILPNSAAVKGWEASRRISISGEGDLPAGPYVIVDMGRRPNSGYGLAVSRQAGVRDEVFILKVSLFEPRPGISALADPSSPCALVRLPAKVSFKSLKLVDQSGKKLGTAGGYSSAAGR